MVSLSLDPRNESYKFGQEHRKMLSDLRFHLVLPGILDINNIMETATKAFQNCRVNVLEAGLIMDKMSLELDALITLGENSRMVVATKNWLTNEKVKVKLAAESDTGIRF